MQKATDAAPLYVTRRDIERFEEVNPVLRGIGEVMIRRGQWVVRDENSDSRVSGTVWARAVPSYKQQHEATANADIHL